MSRKRVHLSKQEFLDELEPLVPMKRKRVRPIVPAPSPENPPDSEVPSRRKRRRIVIEDEAIEIPDNANSLIANAASAAANAAPSKYNLRDRKPLKPVERKSKDLEEDPEEEDDEEEDEDYHEGDEIEEQEEEPMDMKEIDPEDEDLKKELKRELKEAATKAFLKKFNPLAHKEYIKTLKYIEENKPNIIDILRSPMRREDKALVFQMYEVLMSTAYPSEEYLTYHKTLVKEIQDAKRRYIDYCKLPQEMKDTYKESRERLLAMSSSLPLDHQIVALDADDRVKGHILKEYIRMCQLGSDDDEKAKVEKWVLTCLSLPFRRCKPMPDNRGMFLRQMSDALEANIYGLEKVKEQLLVFANARMSNPEMKECTLGLVGPPGIGKTMIARLISTCLNIPFAQISCGGITEPETLRGHSYTYVGSRPGEITNALIELGYSNGVIFFDEFEKIAQNQAITSMLLHVLDPLQNNRYQDHYLGRDVTLNLSGIWFVMSMNELPIDSALRDRIFTINLSGYKTEEKFHIAKKHLIPKHFKNMNIPAEDITMPDDTIRHMIQVYGEKQPGVRALNRALREVIAKIHFLQQSDVKTSFTIKNISKPYTVHPPDVEKLIEKPEQPLFLSMYS